MALPKLLCDGPARAPLTVALAHGAGAPMDSPFMNIVAEGLSDAGWRVARFDFPYMAARRSTGKKKPPDRLPVLLETWRAVIDEIGADKLVIGGKSMGGRIATLICDDAGVRGVVALGYPFHPPGKPEKLRTEHLERLKTPTLVLQGERDPFGTAAEVPAYPLSRRIKVQWLPDGDHSLKPRKKSGHTEAENLARAVKLMDRFLKRRAK